MQWQGHGDGVVVWIGKVVHGQCNGRGMGMECLDW